MFRMHHFAALFALLALAAPATADELLTGKLQSLLTRKPVVEEAAGTATPATLATLIEGAGYEAKLVKDGLYQSSIKSGTWTFPATFSFASQNKQILVTLILTSEPDLAQTKLVKMLAANAKYAPCFFELHGNGKLTFTRPIANTADLTPQRLKLVVDYTAKLAVETAEIWASESQSTPPHVGVWMHSDFKLVLDGSGRYRLDQLNGNGVAVGRYSVQNGRLTLTPDQGNALVGDVRFDGRDVMVFTTAPGASGVRFERQS